MVTVRRNTRRSKAGGALALLAVASALSSATLASAASPGSGSWWKRQDPTAAAGKDPSVLKLINATGPYASMVPGSRNADAIESAVCMSGDIPSQVVSAFTPAATSATPTDAVANAADAIVQAVEASPSPTASAAKVASENLDAGQESQLQSELAGEPASEGEASSWTYDPGAFGCGFGTDPTAATLCSISAPSSTPSIDAAEAIAEAVLSDAASGSAFVPLSPAAAKKRSPIAPTPTPQSPTRRQLDPSDTSNLFLLFTSYITLEPPPPLVAPGTASGNGEAPGNINNPNSPDLGWLDLQVGAVPYKNGDLIASIV
ncbi:hypothetical protein NDA16_000304 [Ustilago loliicola]|nr:hypothetical protein NDA16_000304 [Ustilago loliicola]